MSAKSLVAAKALGGGILGGGSIVGAGYGLTKYFKSEESNTSEKSSQSGTEIVGEAQESEALPGVPSIPTENPRRDESLTAQDNTKADQIDSSLERTPVVNGAGSVGKTPETSDQGNVERQVGDSRVSSDGEQVQPESGISQTPAGQQASSNPDQSTPKAEGVGTPT